MGGAICGRTPAGPPSIPDQPDTPRPRPPAPDLLLRAAARLLRPLVRLLLRSGVTFPVLADTLRGLYVEVARDELLDGKSRTDSRISLLTGIHRKELRRQREPGPPDPEPVALTRSSAVLARWLATELASLPRTGPPPSFEALVASVTRDVRPRAVLDELLGAGAVRLDGDAVVLNADAFVPRDGDEARLFYFARNLGDHLDAAGTNLLAPGAPPFLERAAHYDSLSADAAASLAAAGRAAAQAMLLDVNRTALGIADADDATRPPGAPTRRVNLGVFLFVSDEPAP